jgi:ankyrin repeat protein
MKKAVLLLFMFCKNDYCNSLPAVNDHKKTIQELIREKQKKVEGVKEDNTSFESETSEVVDKKPTVSNYSKWAVTFGITGLTAAVSVLLRKYVRSLFCSSGNQGNNMPGNQDRENFNREGEEDSSSNNNSLPPSAPRSPFASTLDMSGVPGPILVIPTSNSPKIVVDASSIIPITGPLGKKDSQEAATLGLQLIEEISLQHSNISIIKDLIKRGADINVQGKDNYGYTPLHVAAVNNKVDIIALLLAAEGINIDIRNQQNMTPLHAAAEGGSKQVIELLLNRGADVNAVDNSGQTPLHIVLIMNEHGLEEIVKLLFARGADINAQSDSGTPLHNAVGTGKVDIVSLFLNDKNINVNLRGNEITMTPFELAEDLKYKEIVDLFSRHSEALGLQLINEIRSDRSDISKIKNLIKRGADINVADRGGNTPLHVAADNDKADIIALLLEAEDIDINIKGRWGQTPLHMAARRGNKQVIKLFLDRGFDVNAKGDNGETPLHIFLIINKHGLEEIVKLFLTRGADINAQSSFGTPLYEAVSSHKVHIVSLLLNDKNINVNLGGNENTMTPFELAEYLKYKEIVDLFSRHSEALGLQLIDEIRSDRSDISKIEDLIKRGANSNVVDINGNTPLHVAVLSGNERAVKLLLDHGADIDAKNNSETTPVELAKSLKLEEIENVLSEHFEKIRSN